MAIFNAKELQTAVDIGTLGLTNPFMEKRIELERRILGDAFVPLQDFWNATSSMDDNANVAEITRRAHELLHMARARLSEGQSFENSEEKEIYRALAQFALYYVCQESFYRYIQSVNPSVLSFEAFEEQVKFYFPRSGSGAFDDVDAARLYSLFFVIRRAFHFIFRYIFGGSRAVARLRAAVWESVFTSCMARYYRTMYSRMDKISTLILGKTGTGKDLVARAIGVSRYIPYDKKQKDFAAPFADNYFPLNLTALSPTLIEAELFGYVRGAFTGAQKDTDGFLDHGGPYCTLFLDEIGDVSADIQVKLLRVLQSGEYTRVGTRAPQHFEGKIIAATNLNLTERIEAGHFREDLYFRLCSDVIQTPTLSEQISENPEELTTIVRQLASNIAGETECEGLTKETIEYISTQMPKDYPWPGNIRELEQCVCNILVRGQYEPMKAHGDASSGYEQIFKSGSITASELISIYCTHVYAQTGSYVETAKRLDIDRRTVKSRVDEALLEKLRG